MRMVLGALILLTILTAYALLGLDTSKEDADFGTFGTRNEDCPSCHYSVNLTLASGKHAGRSCTDCHDPNVISELALIVECTDCHIGPRNQIYLSDRNKCVDCHDEDYGEIFLEWQNSVKNLIRSLKTTLAERKKLSLSKEEKAKVLNIERALRNIEFDGSSGIHNYSKIEEMLTNFQKTLKSFGENPLNE